MVNLETMREMAMHFKVGARLNAEAADALLNVVEHGESEEVLMKQFFGEAGQVPPIQVLDAHTPAQMPRGKYPKVNSYTLADGSAPSGRYSRKGLKRLTEGRRRRAKVEKYAKKHGISYQAAKLQIDKSNLHEMPKKQKRAA